MRIIAGRFKGRKLATVRGAIRPTPDRLRETLFDVLGTAVVDSVWIDLFAGSGAVGIEALSRGARFVLFNDRERSALQLVEKNLRLCGIEGQYELSSRDGITLLRKPPLGEQADFFFLDPPYKYGRYRKLLERIVDSVAFNKERSTILLEIFKKTEIDFLPESLAVVRTVQCGDSHVLIMRGRMTDRPEEQPDAAGQD